MLVLRFAFTLIEGKEDLFKISESSSTQNLPYDYHSIMHYKAFEFSKNITPTIQSLNASIPQCSLGNSGVPTSFDILHINLLYCEGKWE